jgi:hypothetical protein
MDLRAMSVDEVKRLQRRTDECICASARLMWETPQDSEIYRTMMESRKGLLAFRDRVDDELDRRGY